ncbi:MAG: hypothetical protein M3Y64_10900 [Gemmatimonadota bacterium]|nr:hypothetical protein [Gemmatimonadota bacterium]
MSTTRSIVFALCIVAVGGCTKDVAKAPAADTTVAEIKGSCANVYNSQVCTRAKTQGGQLMEVGIIVPIAAIENAPAKEAMVWPPVAVATLEIPGTANQSAIRNFSMYWEAGGHPPGPYLTPHFDFHFNTAAAADIAAIDCTDVNKPATLPAGYALPDIPLPPPMAKMMGVKSLIGSCVPKMGMHSLPASELESKATFRGSMVVGYYKGKPIFIEPMLTKAMLMEKKSFDLAMPDVPGLVGAHPTKFHAEFDQAKQEYQMTFSQFVAGI